MFKAVVFDCDGVIVDSEATIQKTLQSFMPKHYGITVSEEDYETVFFGRSPQQNFTEFFAKHGIDKDVMTEIHRYKAELSENLLQGASVVSGVRDVINALQVPIGLATGGMRFLTEVKLKAVGLYDTFTPQISATCDVEHGKPAPDVYLLACEKLGVAPHDALAIEDSPNGARAAVAAGLTVWGLLQTAHNKEQRIVQLQEVGAAQIFNTHNEILNAFREKGIAG